MTEHSGGLNPETEAIVAALIAVGNTESIGPVDEEALARFACGWVTEDEQDAVIAALTKSSGLRDRLLEMKAALERSQESAEARLQMTRDCGPLGRVLDEALRASMTAFSHWNEVCRHVQNAGSDELRTVRAELMKIGASLRSAPVGFATTRADSLQTLVLVHPGDVNAELTVWCDEKDTLFAKARFLKPFEEPKEVSLYVVEPGGAWAWLGSSVAVSSHWSLEAHGCSRMLDIPPGDFSSQWFTLAEGKYFAPRRTIKVRVGEEARTQSAAPYVHLRLWKGPEVCDGVFRIGLELPETLRESYLNAKLTAALDIGSTAYFLGSWPLADLPEDRHVELAVPLAGVPDAEMEIFSAVSLSFRGT